MKSPLIVGSPPHPAPPRSAPPGPKVGALTFDVEEWFHAHNLSIPRSRWSLYPSRLERQIDDILATLDDHGTKATFFVLGQVAARNPSIVRRLWAAGHEIASHGYDHQSITELDRSSFHEDVRHSQALLEDLTGQRVRGYRAPSYSLRPELGWPVDVLEQLGFAYDSSIYPVRAPHRRYGSPGTSLRPYRLRSSLWEFPLPTVRVMGLRLPVATGAYLRIWPPRVTMHAIQQNLRESIPVVVNVHPWELDVDQPRVQTSWWHRKLHYTNLHTTLPKLRRLLDTCRFKPLLELLAECEGRSTESRKFREYPSRGLEARADSGSRGVPGRLCNAMQ
ncbi:MAG: DUF3473 domain-containing protein [Planctomycetes bacterium]|nr:DUF3473 domain-containing protein [Planctomycetota bacterium]